MPLDKYDKSFAERIKRNYPAGTKIDLDRMDDPYRDMPKGLKGIVDAVDDIGSIHCTWENGSTLAVIPGEGSFHIIVENEQDYTSDTDIGLER